MATERRAVGGRRGSTEVQGRVEVVTRLINGFVKMCKYSAFVAVAYFISDAAKSFAGHQTSLVALFDAGLKMQADRWIAYSIACLSGTGWAYERRLRKKTTASQAETIKKLERLQDPNRSSSGLAISGEPEEDEEEDE